MQEITKSDPFSCVIMTKDLGYGRKKQCVINTDTGEIVLEKYEGKPQKAFILGAGVCPLSDSFLGVERLDTGVNCFYVTDYSEGDPPKVWGPIWENKNSQPKAKPKHTGGKPEYLKLFASELEKIGQKLQDQDIGAAFRLAAFCDWKTGILVHPRTKKPLDYEELKKVTKYANNTLSRRISTLKKAEVLLNNDKGNYVINPKLLQKGV